MTIRKEIETAFDLSIDVNDTIWYTRTQTLFDKIMSILENHNVR